MADRVPGGAKSTKTWNYIAIGSGITLVVALIVYIVLMVVAKKKRSNAPAASYRKSRLVTDLDTEKQARVALAGSKPTIVFIYADWCGFCKRAEPVFAELAKDPAYAHITMLKLNSTKAAALGAEKGIRGFPAFLVNWGNVTTMEGYKPKADMEAFLKTAKSAAGGVRMGNARGGVVTESGAKAALSGASPVVVFLSADWCGFCKKLMPLWEEAAASGKFTHVNMMRIDAKDAPTLVKEQGITGFPVLLSNKGERKYIGYRPKDKLEELLAAVGAS